MDRCSKIEFIGAGILFGFALCILISFFQVYEGVNYTFFHYLLTRQGPLFVFGDFEQIYRTMIYNDPYVVSAPAPYFPFSFILSKLFNWMPIDYAVCLFISMFILFSIWYWALYLGGKNKLDTIKNILIYSFFTYPFLFSLQRANYENLVFMFLGLFIFFYQRNRGVVSAIFLALAIAMKLYPAVFLLVYLSDKKYKELFCAVIVSVALTMLSYAALYKGFSHNLFAQLSALKYYNTVYVINNAGWAYGNSIYGMAKVFVGVLRPNQFVEISNLLCSIIPIISILIFSLILSYIYFFETVFWRKVALVSFSACILPHVSADYKLLLIYIPLFLFINDNNQGKLDKFYSTLFVLLLIPKFFYYFSFSVTIPIEPYLITTSVVLTPLLMLMMMIVIMFDRVKTGKAVTFDKA